jgi:hypothetical protein
MKQSRLLPSQSAPAHCPRGLSNISFGWALLALSCGSPSVLVPKGPHVPSEEAAPIRVKRPPPPAQIEVMPLRRNNECFYRDGSWSPKGRSWTWTKGDWVLVPDGCYYAPAQTRYEILEIGTTLVHRSGSWHPVTSKGQSKCAPVQTCPDANAGQ